MSQLLPAEITVREALESLGSSGVRTWLVMDRRGVIGVINRARLERELAEVRIRSSVNSRMRWFFRTSTPTKRLIWRSNAWAPTRSKSCRW